MDPFLVLIEKNSCERHPNKNVAAKQQLKKYVGIIQILSIFSILEPLAVNSVGSRQLKILPSNDFSGSIIQTYFQFDVISASTYLIFSRH